MNIKIATAQNILKSGTSGRLKLLKIIESFHKLWIFLYRNKGKVHTKCEMELVYMKIQEWCDGLKAMIKENTFWISSIVKKDGQS